MNGRIYLDHNATTPPAPEVVEAMHRALADLWGNPSSAHAHGRAARLEDAGVAHLAARFGIERRLAQDESQQCVARTIEVAEQLAFVDSFATLPGDDAFDDGRGLGRFVPEKRRLAQGFLERLERAGLKQGTLAGSAVDRVLFHRFPVTVPIERKVLLGTVNFINIKNSTNDSNFGWLAFLGKGPAQCSLRTQRKQTQ